MKKFFILFIILISISAGCFFWDSPKPKKELLVYVSAATHEPLGVLAKLFERKQECKVLLIVGGSGNLYESILINKTGDLFLPGTNTYIDQLRNHDMVLQSTLFAWNRPALITNSKNKRLTGNVQLSDMLQKSNSVIIANPMSSSIGKVTKEIMQTAQMYDNLLENVTGFAIDANDLMETIKEGKNDITINWQAMASWPQYKDFARATKLDNTQRLKIELAILKTTKNHELSQAFLNFVTSEYGKNIFQKYGFEITYDKSNAKF